MIEITKKTVLAIGGTVTALCARVTKITIYGDGTNTALLTVKDSNGGTVIDKLEARTGGVYEREFFHPYPGQGGSPAEFTLSVGAGTATAYIHHTD